jgi:hypothetical protein
MTSQPNSAQIERERQAFIKKMTEIARKENKKKPPQEKEKTTKVK